MAINIKKNDYIQPLESREEVVQGICNAFLDGGAGSIFYPKTDSLFRNRTIYLQYPKPRKNVTGYFSFCSGGEEDERYFYIRIRGCEMKQAFKELIDAGYFMFRTYIYGWMGYRCDKRPIIQEGERVFSFEDFID